ncbi:cytochrome c oxidase assembly protein subunit 15 [Inquilinus ginsengisoli]|uniref:Heme A synthase n=1 Tax=Inquilinus ginsengisoli TaxID=363840 RepID=A0ABU1JT74_9PROT|nr:COX15/CtaA family protein [Inquilinus ginsengisoli]MDR6291817.1 cytochrome c oxidase assembly protein subunit 15 [Inquilinus ginsengisoli]
MQSTPAAAALRPTVAQPARRSVAAWLFLSAAMVFAAAVIGAITRLTESGLSIVEWAPIKGIVPPLSDQAWVDAFAAYKATPQYLYTNSGMSLDAFKGIFFWEWLHRAWDRLSGLVFAAGLAWFAWRRALGWNLGLRLLALLVVGGLQGVLGWVMVRSGLDHRPSVSHYLLAAHLGLAVLLYALILWAAYGLVLTRQGNFAAAPSLRRHAAIAIGCVAVTMCWGAFVAGLDAGQVYNTFPLMDGRFLPPEAFSIIPGWLNLFDNTALVQFTHRWLAIGTALVVLALAVRTTRTPVAGWGHLVGLMVLVQVGLGISTLLTQVPVGLGAMHQAGALVLLALLLALRFVTRPVSESRPK